MRRKWVPRGRPKRVRVESVERTSRHVAISLRELTADGGEGPRLAIVQGPGSYAGVKQGQVGHVAFVEGGPAGGQWTFTGGWGDGS